MRLFMSAEKPRIALCLENPILDFGGTEVLVAELVRRLAEHFAITLVSEDRSLRARGSRRTWSNTSRGQWQGRSWRAGSARRGSSSRTSTAGRVSPGHPAVRGLADPARAGGGHPLPDDESRLLLSAGRVLRAIPPALDEARAFPGRLALENAAPRPARMRGRRFPLRRARSSAAGTGPGGRRFRQIYHSQIPAEPPPPRVRAHAGALRRNGWSAQGTAAARRSVRAGGAEVSRVGARVRRTHRRGGGLAPGGGNASPRTASRGACDGWKGWITRRSRS